MSKGRLRLGIGTGWNAVEYEALNENFSNRGKRSEEQIDLMRKLWADPAVSYDGEWHKVTDAGLNPLPGRKIPVWLGGMAPQVVDRVGRLADGWFPFFSDKLGEQLAQVKTVAEQHGRSMDDIGIEVISPLGEAGPKQLDQLKGLADMGVTHSAVVTMNHNLASPRDHIDALKRYRDATGSLA